MLVSQPSTSSNTPLTFPYQRVTDVLYKSTSGSPTPSNVSNSGWDTPVVVMGNMSSMIILQNASTTGLSGSVVLQILNSTTDPNRALGTYQAVVYPTSPLLSNVQYSVTLTDTVNGTALSRNFMLTIDNVVG